MARIVVDIVYNDTRFDPRSVRRMLGLDGNDHPAKLESAERLRLANLLRRTGNLGHNDLVLLRMRVVAITEKRIGR